MQSATAILIFSRSASSESATKTICRGKENVIVISQLIHHTLRVAQCSGLPYFFYDEYKQKGNCFGERLTNAIENITAKSFQKIIVIGNDCLQLDKQDFLKTVSLLHTNDAVIKPSKNGGICLFALNAKAYDREKILAVDWQTSKVLSQMQNYFSTHGICFSELNRTEDINHYEDIVRLLYTNHAFAKQLMALVSARLYFIRFFFNLDYIALCTNAFRRGPPSSSSIPS